MLKLNASYSKKVPADGEYTSQSYHASVEIELSDGLSAEQLNSKIHETFELVRNSVEAELHENTPCQQGGNTSSNTGNQPVQGSIPASPKQIKYLLDLARNNGVTPQQILTRFKVNALEELTRNQCSLAIDEFNNGRKAA